MRNIFKKLDTFKLIFITFGIVFSFILFLSIPTIFNYKILSTKIEKKIESDFSLKVSNIKNIKYRFIPSPHLNIGSGNFYLDDNQKNLISELKDIKLYVSIFNLYKAKNIKIKKIIFEKENFYLNYSSLRKIIDHIYNKKTKEIIIKKSKFFIIDPNKNVSTISPLQKFRYFTNNKTNQKKIKITGNIFDTDYDFKWSNDANSKNLSNFNMKFKNPNILLQNSLEIQDHNKREGEIKINFISNKLYIDYTYDKKLINFKSREEKNSPFSIDGNINLSPFYFNFESNIKNNNIDIIIKSILLNYFNFKDQVHPNLNGTININLKKIKNAYFNNGHVKFSFNNSQIIIDDNKINVRNIGEINLIKNSFYEQNGNVFFITDLVLNINDEKEFYKRLSIPIKNRVNLKKIFLTLEKNIDNDNFSIYNFSINKKSKQSINGEGLRNLEKLEFDNFQKFRKIIKDYFSNLS